MVRNMRGMNRSSNDKGLSTRCNPDCVTSVANLLPTAVIQRIEELGFKKMLDLKSNSLGCRKICGLLMDKAVVHARANQI
jgi:hypothetical protein